MLNRRVGDFQVGGCFFLRGWAQCQGLEEKLDSFFESFVADPRGLHQIVDRGQRSFDFLAVVNEIQVFVFVGNLVEIIGKLPGLAWGAVSHETQDCFRVAGNLRRLSAVDRVKKRVIAQPMILTHRQLGRKTAHAKVVAIFKTSDVAIQTKIDFDLTFEAGGNMISVGP